MTFPNESMYSENKMGPRIEPRGTPHISGAKDEALFRRTRRRDTLLIPQGEILFTLIFLDALFFNPETQSHTHKGRRLPTLLLWIGPPDGGALLFRGPRCLCGGAHLPGRQRDAASRDAHLLDARSASFGGVGSSPGRMEGGEQFRPDSSRS